MYIWWYLKLSVISLQVWWFDMTEVVKKKSIPSCMCYQSGRMKYNWLCKKYVQDIDDRGQRWVFFAYCFMTFEWTPLSCADVFVDASVKTLSGMVNIWLYKFEVKWDQPDETTCQPSNVYFNPLKPHMCPFIYI